jgi:eukaryotic-like serine/threonine-protein kinase
VSTELTQLGRYRILAELGRGSMGVVYKAEDPLLNRAVAIKTIILSADPEERAEYEARFYQEAKAAGGLNHPNTITIHDIGREDDIAYMAMELLEGVELRDMMKRGRVPLPLALDIAAQVAVGLAFAHERGVVHRDIKPGNIMIVHDRHAKIMDFGIARMRLSDVKTQAGAILGSPKYMSPEQVTGMRADHRSDIFSLGIMLYELAAGAPPFSGTEVSLIMHQIATVTPRPPSAINPSLPPMLDMIAAKALQKNPDARYQSAAELAADLRACLDGLSGQQSGPPADFERTVRLEEPAARTVKIDAEVALARPVNVDGSKTVPSGGAGITSDSGTYLYLSRHFNSAEALLRFTELAVADGGAVNPNTSPVSPARVALHRLWQDPARRAFAVAVIAATVVASVVAFS